MTNTTFRLDCHDCGHELGLLLADIDTKLEKIQCRRCADRAYPGWEMTDKKHGGPVTWTHRYTGVIDLTFCGIFNHETGNLLKMTNDDKKVDCPPCSRKLAEREARR